MPTSHRARILGVVHELLRELNPADAAGFVIEVRTSGGTAMKMEAGGEFAPEYTSLLDQPRAVVGVLLVASPLTTEQIAARTGYTENSRLRAVLAELQTAGHIESCEGGYRPRKP